MLRTLSFLARLRPCLVAVVAAGCTYVPPSPVLVAGCYDVDWDGWTAAHDRALGFRVPSRVELWTDRVAARESHGAVDHSVASGMLMLPTDRDVNTTWWLANGKTQTIQLHWGAHHANLVLTVPLSHGRGVGGAEWAPKGYGANLGVAAATLSRTSCDP